MAFASDAHRKWWFANHGGSSGGGGGSSGGGGGDPFAGVHFVTEAEYSPTFGKDVLLPDVMDKPHATPMPQMTSEEKSAFAAYRGDFGK